MSPAIVIFIIPACQAEFADPLRGHPFLYEFFEFSSKGLVFCDFRLQKEVQCKPSWTSCRLMGRNFCLELERAIVRETIEILRWNLLELFGYFSRVGVLSRASLQFLT